MTRQLHACSRRAFGIVAAAWLAICAQTFAATAPYPQSHLITAVTWDFGTVGSLRKALGSDLWPMAWAADGNLYGAWGDGGGFDGDANNIGRVSLGFARIAGAPAVGKPASYAGKNVWGVAPAYAEHPAEFGGKIDDLISVDAVLYGHGGLWTAANCGCPNPILKSGANPAQHNLVWSADLGKTWHIAPWSGASDPGASLQYGQNYKGAWDPAHVYFYYQRDVARDAEHIFLRRVRTGELSSDPATPGHYEYLVGMGGRGTPTWSAKPSAAIPIFFDPSVPSGTYASAGIVYDAALGRYLLAAMHGNFTGQIGFFEAPAPWGPWTTVAYYDDWGGFNEQAGEGNGLMFPAKWISEDGKELWGVFSGVTNGFDAFNVVRAVFTTSSAIPGITVPAADTVLSPGERVTARGTGADLSWSAETIDKGASGQNAVSLAGGSGPVFTFIVPSDVSADTVVRVWLTSREASVYRDYPIVFGRDPFEVGRWEFDEGAGIVAGDSSGAGNVGMFLNRPAWAAGRAGEAVDFHGSRGAVLVGASRSLANLYRHGLTVTAWIKPRSGGASRRILDKDDNAVGWFLKMKGSGLQFVADQFSHGAVSRDAARPINPGVWQHVAATWDGSKLGANIHLYLDGTVSDGMFVNGAGAAGDDSNIPLTIGNRRGDLARGFDGIVDDVRVFDRVLSAAEIRRLQVEGERVPEVTQDFGLVNRADRSIPADGAQ